MKHIPTRTCISCRTPKEKRELVRIVRTKDGGISLDPTGKAAGRGCYVCNADECFLKAVDKKQLSRAFKCEIPRETYDALREKYLAVKQ
jgi:predicted RNA-binding protein YlxR (DUF448 family)